MLTAARRIDSHLHVWDLAVSQYDWLTPQHDSLYASWSPAQAECELQAAGFSGAILVQAEDSRRDTRYLLGIAGQNPWVLGVVGWVQLDDPVRAAQDLDEFCRWTAFCGVRHLINDDLRADFLDQKPVRESLALLAGRGLPFDLHDAWPRHLQQAERLAEELPELTLIIDHLGLPPRNNDDIGAWTESMARLAQLPNTVAKISGLGHPGAGVEPEALRLIWNTGLELFGPDRLMYGGNWPITVPTGGYSAHWQAISELIGELDLADQARILSSTAERIYRL